MIRIFIAYSSKDLVFKNEIRKRLGPLKRAGKIDIWDNYDIEVGKDWDVEVREQLDKSDLILLLLSPDALDSDYFYEVEAPIALRRHEAGEAIAVGILLRPCMDMLKHTPLGDFTKYELLPKKGVPITDAQWHHVDEAYLSVFREVDILVDKVECSREGGKAEHEQLRKKENEDHVFNRLNNSHPPILLTKREREIYNLYWQILEQKPEEQKEKSKKDWGYEVTKKDLVTRASDVMDLTEGTVESHLKKIKRKMTSSLHLDFERFQDAFEEIKRMGC